MTELIPNAEEVRLLEALRPERWEQNAPSRGVRHTVVEDARLTASGVVAKLQLRNELTMKKLRQQLGQIRTLLDVQDDHQTDLLEGGRASRVALAIRTRRVTDTMDMTWQSGATTLGVDTITGREVDVPADDRVLIAGASGSGKSWAARPLIARAVVAGRPVLMLDGKGEEATPWEGIIDTAVAPHEIVDAIEREHAEMGRRKIILKQAGKSSWDPSLGPERLVIVDEGRVVLSILSVHDKNRPKPEEGEEPDIPVLQKLIDLSSLGRSRGIVLYWMTQYPVTSGQNPGIDPQININVDTRFCLRVKTATQAGVVLDDDADYGPQAIPSSKAMRGHGYKAEHGPNLIRTWTVTDEMIRNLKTVTSTSTTLKPSISDRVLSAMESGAAVLEQISKITKEPTKEVARVLTSLMISGKVVAVFDGQQHTYRSAKPYTNGP